MKTLEELSLEELWQLFPIDLKEYNSDYKIDYKKVSNDLIDLIGINIKRINHIGSTAIENILSKPIIDILLEIVEDTDIDEIKNILLKDNWLLMSETKEPYFQLSFNKGYTINGFEKKVYHLHIRYFGNWEELYFRDYLIDHKDIAKEYEILKLKLSEEYKYNRDLYTEKKGKLVKKYSILGKQLYKDKYK